MLGDSSYLSDTAQDENHQSSSAKNSKIEELLDDETPTNVPKLIKASESAPAH